MICITGLKNTIYDKFWCFCAHQSIFLHAHVPPFFRLFSLKIPIFRQQKRGIPPRPACRKRLFAIFYWSKATPNLQNPRTCALDFALDPRHRARNRGYQSQFLLELALYPGGLDPHGKTVEVFRQSQRGIPPRPCFVRICFMNHLRLLCCDRQYAAAALLAR